MESREVISPRLQTEEPRKPDSRAYLINYTPSYTYGRERVIKIKTWLESCKPIQIKTCIVESSGAFQARRIPSYNKHIIIMKEKIFVCVCFIYFYFFHHSWFTVFCQFSTVWQSDPVTHTYIQKYGMLHEFACHPGTGAMLIFSVLFQF